MNSLLNIVLYQPRIPQNTGNVARSCFVTGTRLHLIGPMGFRIDEKQLRRAGLTYWHQTDITTYDSFEEFMEQHQGARMVLLSSHASKKHSNFEFHDGDYIVFGREDAGVPDEVHALFGENQCRIPMIHSDEARCFNLATSVGIVLMEAQRQLGFPGLE